MKDNKNIIDGFKTADPIPDENLNVDIPNKEGDEASKETKSLADGFKIDANSDHTIGYSTYGDRNGDISEYKDVLGDNNVHMFRGTKALNNQMAYEQSHLSQWGNALGKTIFGEIVGGIVEGAGIISEVPEILGRILTNSMDNYEPNKNPLMMLGAGIKELSDDTFKIYMTEEAKEGGLENMFSKGYFPSMIPSMASAISIMIPVMGTSKLLSLIGKIGLRALKVLKTTAKLSETSKLVNTGRKILSFGEQVGVKYSLNVLGNSVLSRHIDNYMEAGATYKEEYQLLKNIGYSDEEAKKHATVGFNSSYFKGYINIGTDLLEWATLLKYSNYAARAIEAKTALKMGKTTYKGIPILGDEGVKNLVKLAKKSEVTVKKGAFDLVKTGIGETVEEIVQEGLGRIAHRDTRLSAGLHDDRTTRDIIRQTLKDPHTFDAGFFGFLGGITFGLVGFGTIVKSSIDNNKNREEKVKAQLKIMDDVAAKIKEIHDAGEKAKTDPFYVEHVEVLKGELENDLVDRGLSTGTLPMTIEMLNNMAQRTNEELEKSGLEANTQEYYRKMAKRLQKSVDEFNKLASVPMGYGDKDGFLVKHIVQLKHRLGLLNEFLITTRNKKQIDIKDLPEILQTGIGNELYKNKVKTEQLRYRASLINKRIQDIKLNLEAINSSGDKSFNAVVKINQLEQELEAKTSLLNEKVEEIDKLAKENLDNKTIFETNNADKVAELEEALDNTQMYIAEAQDNTVSNTLTAIEETEKALSDISLKKSRDAFIKNITDIIEKYKKIEIKKYEAELNAAKTLEELKTIYDNYKDKNIEDFKRLYNARKKKLKKHLETKDTVNKVSNSIDDLATKLAKDPKAELTEAEKDTYKYHKKEVDKLVINKNKDLDKEKAEQEELDRIRKEAELNAKEETTTDNTNPPIGDKGSENEQLTPEELEAKKIEDLHNARVNEILDNQFKERREFEGRIQDEREAAKEKALNEAEKKLKDSAGSDGLTEKQINQIEAEKKEYNKLRNKLNNYKKKKLNSKLLQLKTEYELAKKKRAGNTSDKVELNYLDEYNKQVEQLKLDIENQYINDKRELLDKRNEKIEKIKNENVKLSESEKKDIIQSIDDKFNRELEKIEEEFDSRYKAQFRNEEAEYVKMKTDLEAKINKNKQVKSVKTRKKKQTLSNSINAIFKDVKNADKIFKFEDGEFTPIALENTGLTITEYMNGVLETIRYIFSDNDSNMLSIIYHTMKSYPDILSPDVLLAKNKNEKVNEKIKIKYTSTYKRFSEITVRKNEETETETNEETDEEIPLPDEELAEPNISIPTDDNIENDGAEDIDFESDVESTNETSSDNTQNNTEVTDELDDNTIIQNVKEGIDELFKNVNNAKSILKFNNNNLTLIAFENSGLSMDEYMTALSETIKYVFKNLNILVNNIFNILRTNADILDPVYLKSKAKNVSPDVLEGYTKLYNGISNVRVINKKAEEQRKLADSNPLLQSLYTIINNNSRINNQILSSIGNVQTLEDSDLGVREYIDSIFYLAHDVIAYLTMNPDKRASKERDAYLDLLNQLLFKLGKQITIDNLKIKYDLSVIPPLVITNYTNKLNELSELYSNLNPDYGKVDKSKDTELDDKLDKVNNTDKSTTANNIKNTLRELGRISGTDTDENNKESNSLTELLRTQLTLLDKIIADTFYYYQQDRNSKDVLTVLDIYNLLIDNGGDNLLLTNHQVLKSLFELLRVKGDIIEVRATTTNGSRVKGKLNLAVTVEANNKSYIEALKDYIDARKEAIKYSKPLTDMYLYMPNLAQLKPDDRLDDEVVELLNEYLELQEGDELEVELDLTYKADQLTNLELIKRNNNPNSVPLKVVNKRTGRNVTGNKLVLAAIQTTKTTHNGIKYVDKDGDINIFSANVTDEDIEILDLNSVDIRRLYIFVKEAITSGTVDKTTDVELDLYTPDFIKVLMKMIQTNNPDASPTYERVAHVLEPLFFDVNNVGSKLLTRNDLIEKYKQHNYRFSSDLQNIMKIRNAIAENKKVVMVVSKKTPVIDYRFDENGKKLRRSVKDTLAPIKFNGKKDIVIGVRDENKILNLKTGDRIETMGTKEYNDRFYAITSPKPGVYQKSSLFTARMSDTEYNDLIIDNLIKDLKSGMKASDLIAKYKYYIHYSTSDDIKFFNFKVNNYAANLPASITIRTNNKTSNKFAEITYKNGKFYVKSSNTLSAKGSVVGKSTKRTISDKEFKRLTSNLLRSTLLKRKAETDLTFIDVLTGKNYNTIQDFLIDTDAFMTNLGVLRDKNNKPVTNYRFKSEFSNGSNRSSSTLYTNIEIREKSKQELTREDELTMTKLREKAIDRYGNRSIYQLLDLPQFAVFRKLFGDVLLKSNYSLIVDGTFSTTDKVSRQLMVDTSDKSLVKIHLYDGFIIENGVPLTEAQQDMIIAHELLHPVIEILENQLRENGKFGEYKKSLKNFIDRVEKDLNKQENLDKLTADELKTLRAYIQLNKSDKQDHSEVITYAFTNVQVTAALSKLNGSNDITKGFWKELYDILVKLFDAVTTNRLTDLTNILNYYLHDGNTTVDESVTKLDTNETTENKEVKTEVKEEPKSERPKKSKVNILNKLKRFNNTESEKVVKIDKVTKEAIQLWKMNKTNIQAEYPNCQTQAEFIKMWSDLTKEERIQIIDCL